MSSIACIILAGTFSVQPKYADVYCKLWARGSAPVYCIGHDPFSSQVAAADKRMEKLVLECRARGIKGCLIKYGKSPLSYEKFLQEVRSGKY